MHEAKPLVLAGRDDSSHPSEVPETPDVQPVVRGGKSISGFDGDSADEASSPYSNGSANPSSRAQPPPFTISSDYWDGLINEHDAADFLDVTPRTMQNWRQKGGGPRFVRLSARCIRYTRRLLKAHADARLHGSTAESEQAA